MNQRFGNKPSDRKFDSSRTDKDRRSPFIDRLYDPCRRQTRPDVCANVSGSGRSDYIYESDQNHFRKCAVRDLRPSPFKSHFVKDSDYGEDSRSR